MKLILLTFLFSTLCNQNVYTQNSSFLSLSLSLSFSVLCFRNMYQYVYITLLRIKSLKIFFLLLFVVVEMTKHKQANSKNNTPPPKRCPVDRLFVFVFSVSTYSCYTLRQDMYGTFWNGFFCVTF